MALENPRLWLIVIGSLAAGSLALLAPAGCGGIAPAQPAAPSERSPNPTMASSALTKPAAPPIDASTGAPVASTAPTAATTSPDTTAAPTDAPDAASSASPPLSYCDIGEEDVCISADPEDGPCLQKCSNTCLSCARRCRRSCDACVKSCSGSESCSMACMSNYVGCPATCIEPSGQCVRRCIQP